MDGVRSGTKPRRFAPRAGSNRSRGATEVPTQVSKGRVGLFYMALSHVNIGEFPGFQKNNGTHFGSGLRSPKKRVLFSNPALDSEFG